MKKTLLILVLSFSIFNSFGEKTPFSKKNSFKINPFSLLDWHNQAITFAYERSFKYESESPFSWQIEAGPILANYVIPNEHYRGIKARGDIRYYLKPQKKINVFAAINSGYSYANYSTMMTYYANSSGSWQWSWNRIGAYKLKLVEFEKNVITVNLILGFDRKITENLSIEAYAGLGTRKTEISTKTLNYFMPGWTPVEYYDMSGFYVVPGKFNYANLTGGMKFCFAIK